MEKLEYLRFYLLLSCESKFRDLKAYNSRTKRSIELGHESKGSELVERERDLWKLSFRPYC